MKNEYLNTDEVAAHLRLTRRTIYRLVSSGQLAAFQSSKKGRLRFTKLQLDEYLNNKKHQVAAELKNYNIYDTAENQYYFKENSIVITDKKDGSQVEVFNNDLRYIIANYNQLRNI